MKHLKQTIGFFFESSAFIFGGFFIGIGKQFIGFSLLICAFALAYWTGEQIRIDSIKELGEENVKSNTETN